ncbi:MAG: response regulator transcription factor [Gemmataceae bacterium]|nr:response regulator transcription factor [Gemmataceae bacterium]
MRILLVAGHDAPASALNRPLAEAGYAVDSAHRAEDAAALAEAGRYCLVLLDMLAPSLGGLDLLRGWRSACLAALVLALSSGRTDDSIACLEAGADDCMGSPPGLPEFMARVRALLRRRHAIKSPLLRIDDLSIDTTSRAVKRAGRPVHLTRREYSLLEYLAFRQGESATRSEILQALWSAPDAVRSNIVDSTVRNLRAKIDDGREQPLILTRWGEGYALRI